MPPIVHNRLYLLTLFLLIAVSGLFVIALILGGDHPNRGMLLAVIIPAAAVAIALLTSAFLRRPGPHGEQRPSIESVTSRLPAGIDRAQLAAVLEHNADGIMAIDGAGRLRFLNGAARRLLEIGDRDPIAESALGRSFVSILRDHDLDDVLRATRETAVQQTRVIQLGRHGRPVEAIFLPLQDAGEWRYLGLLHDLTELRRAEGLRRDLVSNLSHELRTPLSSIRAAVEVLTDGALEEREVARDFLAAIQHEVDRLAQLVEEMLELSRIESGAVPFDFEAVDAGELCREAVRRLEAQAERKGITVRCAIEEGIRPIRADHERLLRVLLNLIHNAIKFTDRGGVSVEAKGGAEQAEIVVRDTGHGIAPADRDRIFERFYKVDRARSTTGTGLGLAIVKHSVQAHGGRVEVESTPGSGSAFHLFLPYAS